MSELPATCLATCSSGDADIANNWKNQQCARVSPDTASPGPKTTTIAARISTYTSGTMVVTSTIQPAVTTVINGNSNANSNANTINVNTGSARGFFSDIAM